MNSETLSERDQLFLRFAVEAAKGSLHRGYIPIAAIVADDTSLISLGVNERVQKSSLTLHAETAALENSGREAVPRLRSSTMYCTMSPCEMCSGAILIYQIPRIIVADRTNFEGPTETLRAAGTTVLFADDEDAITMFRGFAKTNPELWREDNGGR